MHGRNSANGWGLARRLFVAHCVFIVVLTVLVSTAAFVDARDRGYATLASRMLSLAVAIADSPLVVTAAQSSDPTGALQSYTLAVTERADVEVISILSPTGIRWTHPNAALIGQRDTDSSTAAATGVPSTEVTSGAEEPWVRARVPVLDPDGTVVGLVVAGVTTSTLQTMLDARLPAIVALAAVLLAASTVVLWLLTRHLRRVTLGWGPEGLAQHVLRTDAVLRSVRDGVLLVDRRGALVLYNDQAAKLLGLPPRSGPRAGPPLPAIDDLGLPESLVDLLGSARTVRDETHVTDNRVLTVSQEPAFPSASRGRSRTLPLGTVTTIRDPLEPLGAVAAPVVGALLAGKVAQAPEPVLLTVAIVGGVAEAGVSVQDLASALGDLLDDAIAAAAAGTSPGQVTVGIRTDVPAPAVVVEVSGGGPGGTARSVTIPGPHKPAERESGTG